MWKILGHRGLRLVFIANMISMLGSGLNSTGVIWHIFQKTHSEMNLAWLVILQTVPGILLLPFTGVVIDREDRRWMVMWLDALRGLLIAAVMVLVFMHRVQIWQLYLMNTLVAAGFWMFWPTITALIQELTPDTEFVHSNTILMAGVQGGWLIAGAIVGFLYNHIGLGGILLIDVSTYVVSFSLYFGVRRGKHVVRQPTHVLAHLEGMGGVIARYMHELKEGMHYLNHRPAVIMLGVSWALFLGAMLTSNIITAPLCDRILHSGAVGYGQLNGAWGTGAFISALFAAKFIAKFTGRVTVAITMGLLAMGMFGVPHARWEIVAVGFYLVMGCARGLAGIAITSSIMEYVPKEMIGRVQNTFYFAGTTLQLFLGLAVGSMAFRYSLTLAFAIIAAVYGTSSLLTMLPAAKAPVPGTAAVTA
jgi:DHA3 family macrolide efflux protein-like MFS transporter